MLKIDKLSNLYTWQIAVKIPNNGQFDKLLVRVKYHRLPHDERMQLLNQITELAGKEGDDTEKLKAFNQYQDELLNKVFAGWEKGQVTDESGEVEDDAAGREQLLQITEFRNALMAGYQESVGGEKIKEGNS